MVDRAFERLWTLVSFLVHFFCKALTNLLAESKVAPLPYNSGTNGMFLFKGGEPEADGGGGGWGGEKGVHAARAMTTKMKMKRRPARIAIPEFLAGPGFSDIDKDVVGEKEVEVEGSAYCLFSRRGKKRHAMEDGYRVMTDINGDPKQAFFGVFDGHGGRAAVDFVSEELGNNIVRNLAEVEGEGEGEGEERIGTAIKQGYLTTDKEFLSKGMSSGACAATVLLKDGVLHAANAGDCRVVMSERGVAVPLTKDHCPGREDERIRIESSGGYVHCRNGVWRVQDSLAVSRSFGDSNLKEWIISEPETNMLPLTSECQSLIIASDGLWNKVTDQEAVDVVSARHGNLMKSCKDLVDISCSRGSRDDVSVMVVDLQRFVQLCG